MDERCLLHDEEYYIRSNGIESQSCPEIESLYQREEILRVEREQCYQQETLQKIMQEDKSGEENEEAFRIRRKVLESCKDLNLSIKTAGGIVEASMYGLSKNCEVIYTLASSGHWCSLLSKAKLEFSLEDFSISAVRDFVCLVEDHQGLEDLSSNNVIECCRIAHFLQSAILFNDIVEIIRSSIDTDNCAAICNLADQLNEPSLFISSIPLVTKRLEEIQKDDAWNDFSPSLKNHVITLRNAFESRIAAKGKKSKALYTSSNEFLALLSDHLFEQRERLSDAVNRQNEVIAERKQRNSTQPLIRHEDVMGGSVSDAAIKIEKQEIRIQTLEAFFREQKAIFAKDATTARRYERPFIL